MATRPMALLEISDLPATSGSRCTARTLVAAAAVALLSACGSGGTVAGGSTTTGATTASAPPTVTVTVTRTATPAATPSVVTGSRTVPARSITIPPPAKDNQLIPDNATAYGEQFVAAWVARDRKRATVLGSPAAVDTAFESTVRTAPRLQGCEGAAGSVYCTYEGAGYSMTVRVLNQLASTRQAHAVTEVKFAH